MSYVCDAKVRGCKSLGWTCTAAATTESNASISCCSASQHTSSDRASLTHGAGRAAVVSCQLSVTPTRRCHLYTELLLQFPAQGCLWCLSCINLPVAVGGLCQRCLRVGGVLTAGRCAWRCVLHTLPPGNSHRPAMALPSGRCASRTRCCWSISATATTSTIFLSCGACMFWPAAAQVAG